MTTSPTKKALALAYSLIAAAIVLGIVVMQVKAANKPAEDEFINAKYFSKRRYH